MSFFSAEPPSNSAALLRPTSGRPTKLTPEVLSILAGLLDSGIPESPTHLLKLLADRGVPMSRPTVFKAIEKLGRNGNIQWRRRYYDEPLGPAPSTADLHITMSKSDGNHAAADAKNGAGIPSLEKYAFIDNGVLDLRTPQSLCNQTFLLKAAFNRPFGEEKITTAPDEERPVS